MRLIIDADVSGLLYAGQLWQALRARGMDITDGQSGFAEYPDIALTLARRVASGEFDRGILVCKTGMGMAIAANKVPGIFAAVCESTSAAEELADARGGNVLVLGARDVPAYLAPFIVERWLQTPFGHRPNMRRLREIDKLARALSQ